MLVGEVDKLQCICGVLVEEVYALKVSEGIWALDQLVYHHHPAPGLPGDWEPYLVEEMEGGRKGGGDILEDQTL